MEKTGNAPAAAVAKDARDGSTSVVDHAPPLDSSIGCPHARNVASRRLFIHGMPCAPIAIADACSRVVQFVSACAVLCCVPLLPAALCMET